MLERGLAQRVRALDRFVADAYGKQEIVEAEVLGPGARGCDHFERGLVGLPAPPCGWRSPDSTLCATPAAASTSSRTTCGPVRRLPTRSPRARRSTATCRRDLRIAASRSTTCWTRWRRRCAQPHRRGRRPDRGGAQRRPGEQRVV